MAFKVSGSMDPHGAQILRKVTIAGTVTITEMDSTILSSGTVALGTTGTLVLGNVDSIVTKDGVGVTSDGAGGNYEGAYTTASTNATVALVAAQVDISKFTILSVDPDATIATTTGSNLFGYHTDIADEVSTDEDTAATTTAQYTIHGVDPLDSGNQLVSIYESVVFGL